MGMYDTVTIESGIEFPEFPHVPSEYEWQTKELGAPARIDYRITDDGRLEQQKTSYREKTDEEKDEMAREFTDYDTWDEWVESDTDNSLITNTPLPSWERTVDETWWVDAEQHGSFEFHATIDETRWSYEARFTNGTLDEFVLLYSKDVTSY